MKQTFFTLSLMALSFAPAAMAQEIAMVNTKQFQPIKAEIVKSDPSEFTINVRNMSNLGADQKADVFSVYTASSQPEQCADFTNVELPYEKPEKYLRVFDLSDKPEIMTAIEKHQCVAVKNIPAS